MEMLLLDGRGSPIADLGACLTCACYRVTDICVELERERTGKARGKAMLPWGKRTPHRHPTPGPTRAAAGGPGAGARSRSARRVRPWRRLFFHNAC